MRSLTGNNGGSPNDVPNDTVLTLVPPLIDDEEELFELVDMTLHPEELDLVLLQYNLRLINVDSILHLTFVRIDSLPETLTVSRSIPMYTWIEAL